MDEHSSLAINGLRKKAGSQAGSKGAVYIKTFGCSLNQADSETMAGLLEQSGYEVIINHALPDNVWQERPESKKEFDAIIINTCTVKNLSETKFRKEMRTWIAKGKKVIVAGCIPQAEPAMLQDELKDVAVIGTRQITGVVEILDKTMRGKVIHNISNEYNERLNLPKRRKSAIVEIIPISEGCLSHCSFCKTKFARGDLHSYPREAILEQFKNAVSEGCKEFWITSQDNGCYGFDIYRKEKYFLGQLLKDMLSVEGEFRIRLGMANPDHIDRIKQDLIEVLNHPKMFKFLHIPVQSGSDRVLQAMKRMYTVEEFEDLVGYFRTRVPNLTISTDMIVGFPTESEREFEESMRLIERVRPDIINLSRFWMRKGTAAAKLKPVRTQDSKRRCEMMMALFKKVSAENNGTWLAKTCTALIDDEGKRGTLIARNDSYKQIIIKDVDKSSLGRFVKVRVESTGTFELHGRII